VRPELVQTGRQLGEFLRLPLALHASDPHYVPPLLVDQRELLSSRNPYMRRVEMAMWLARRGSRTLGRIAALIDPRFQEGRVGLFGFFDAPNDLEVAQCLLEAACRWLAERGARSVLGPVNPSTNESCGLLVEGFDRDPYVMMPYNPPYYPQLLESTGFQKAKDLLAFEVDIERVPEERLRRVAAKAASRGLRLREPRLRRLEEELGTFLELYNRAWKDNWGFVPLDEEEIRWMARRLKPILVPQLVRVAEVEGRAVGFIFALPNYNEAFKQMRGRLLPLGWLKFLRHRRRIQGARLLTLGVLEGYRRRGIEALLCWDCLRVAKTLGYQRGEMSWVLEDNLPVIAMASKVGARPYKRYRMYHRPLR